MSKQTVDLGARHDHGHALRHLGAGHALEPGELYRQHLAIKEQQRRQRLILRRGADLAVDREMAQKILDLVCAHVPGMTLAVKQDEAADPADVGLFSAQAVMLDPDALADLVQETGSRRSRVCRNARCISHDRLLAKQWVGMGED
jgi:glycerol-3-phosphate dehydrogenase